MDIFSLVAAQLSADNQPVFDPREFDVAKRKAEDRRARWLERLAWIKLVRGDATPRSGAFGQTRHN